ncbi:MAG TPA: protein kinase [Bryobacteraceae bacterium]|nr:protein kinase [Bryobacteraceae bacterium]
MPNCPQCGDELRSADPAGMCPKCLIQGAFDTSLGAEESGTETISTATATPGEDDFGRYRVLSPLGEGGMGTVYLAEQLEPIRRHVALKVVKLGMDTAQVLARFNNERQALAVMDHPNVARIFDAGATKRGRPYFVMEYIDGAPITLYCDRKRMTTKERLALFLAVCRALQHAHQKGVIHRDLKPSNVLVTEQDGTPVPKVIDFGIAKATDKWAVENTLLTEFGQIVGTPEYASPEQADTMTGAIDEISDVYSLGVVLYELLIGAVPFDSATLRGAGLAEMLRIIREEEAPPLPRKLTSMGAGASDIAARRQTDPASLRRLVDGDLNAIAMKALEKVRERRYASVSDLAADIQRHLEDRPVLASPPSRIYRTRKFLRRRRMAALGTAAAAVFLFLSGVTVWSFARNSAPRPKLTARDTIVLADFDNKTGDPEFEDTLRQGLAVELQQSPYLALISDRTVQQTLTLMAQPKDARLTPEIAQQVCERTGSAAVLAGSIARVGSHYVLGLRAKDCNAGNILDQQQIVATRREEVLNALSAMSRKFRTRAGESLATVEKHSMPLSEATTPSFEALKAYSTATKSSLSSGSYEQSIPLLRRAIEIDPNFAMAYAHLGFNYGRKDSALSAEYVTKAWRLRDRVSDRERFYIDFVYERDVTGNLEKAYKTLELWSQTYPRRGALLSNAQDLLGGISTQGTGRFERTMEAALDGIATLPDSPYPYTNLTLAQFYTDRFPAAENTIQRATARKVQMPQLLMLQYNLAALKGDREQMDRIAGSARGNRADGRWIVHAEALALARSGRLRAARQSSGRAVDLARQEREPEVAATYIAARAVWEALCGNSAEARTAAMAALELSTSRDVEYAAGLALALPGSSARSEALSGDLVKRFPEDTFVKFTYAPVLRALASQAKGKFADSVERLEITRSYELAVNGLNFPYLILGGLHSAYVRGGALTAEGRYAEAVAEFQKILDHRGIVGLDPIGALAHLQLGRAFALSGDKAKAKAAYEAFLALWKHADPDISILKSAKAEYGRL